MRKFIKALPIAVGLPVVIGAASVGPDDAASNISKWLNKLGWHNLPAWLRDNFADNRVIVAAIALGTIYTFVFYVAPRVGENFTGKRQEKGELLLMFITIGMLFSGVSFVGFTSAYLWYFQGKSKAVQIAQVKQDSTNDDKDSTSQIVISPATISHQDTGTSVLITKARNFAKNLREFRSEFVTNDKKWSDMEWLEFSKNEDKTKEDEIWNRNNQGKQGRQQTFTNRFHQVYKSFALELSDRLNEQLHAIGIVPLTPGFATPLPPGFDTFKVTIESPAIRSVVTESLIARMADYFDGLANQFPHEVGVEPSKAP